MDWIQVFIAVAGVMGLLLSGVVILQARILWILREQAEGNTVSEALAKDAAAAHEANRAAREREAAETTVTRFRARHPEPFAGRRV